MSGHEATAHEKMKEILQTLENKYLMLIGEYVNTTPWWGRNAFGENVSTINDVQVIGLPTAKSLVGKMRWVMATILSNSCNRNRKSIERIISFMLGSTSMSSLYRLILITENLPRNFEDNNITPYKSNEVARRNVFYFFSNKGNKNYVAISPGTVRIFLAIYRNFLGRDIPSKLHEDFLLKSLELTLYVYGLGYRANRGFGRFAPVGKRDKEINAWSMIEEAEKLAAELVGRSGCDEAQGLWPLSPVSTIRLMNEKLQTGASNRADLTISLSGCRYDKVMTAISEAVLSRSLSGIEGRFAFIRDYRLILGAPRGGIKTRGVERRQSEIVISPVCNLDRGSVCNKVYVLPHYGEDLTIRLFGKDEKRHLKVLAAYSKGIAQEIKSRLQRASCTVI